MPFPLSVCRVVLISHGPDRAGLLPLFGKMQDSHCIGCAVLVPRAVRGALATGMATGAGVGGRSRALFMWPDLAADICIDVQFTCLITCVIYYYSMLAC